MKISLFTVSVVLVCLFLIAVVTLFILGIITISIIPAQFQVLNIPSILMVLAGVFMVTTITYPPEVVKQSIPRFFSIFSHSSVNKDTKSFDILQIIKWQEQLRANKQKTRAELSQILENTFEGYIFGLISTNYSLEEVRSMGVSKARIRYENLMRQSELFGSMGRYSPAFGMLGTLIGLIHMLGNFDSINELAQGLSFALMTTFYGLLFANLVFNPFEGKLKSVAENEYERNRMMLEGIILIQGGNQPLYVFDILNTSTNKLDIESMPDNI